LVQWWMQQQLQRISIGMVVLEFGYYHHALLSPLLCLKSKAYTTRSICFKQWFIENVINTDVIELLLCNMIANIAIITKHVQFLSAV